MGFASPALAYRPFDGTDADVSDYREVELELGPLGYLRQQHDSALVAPAAIFNYGFLPRWEIVIEGSGVFGVQRPPSFVNGGAFLKHVLREGSLQDKTGISLASEVGVLFPTAGTASTVDDTGVYIAFIASYAWRFLAVHVNVSLARATDAQPDLFASTIIEGLPRARGRPVAELYIDRHGGMTTPSILMGFIARINGSLSLDAATRLAWYVDAAAFEVRAGFTWSFGTGGRLSRS